MRRVTTPLSAPPAKTILRTAALARRREHEPALRAAFAARLAELGVAHARALHVQSASLFMPLPGEPDVQPLLAALAQAGFTTLLPVTGARGTPLTFRRWRPGDALVKGQMNIDEPAPGAQAQDPDLMFVPLVAFDRRGHRIGFGAGHYDCTIAMLKAKRRLHTVGVAFASAEVAEVPHEPHDMRLDAVVTEREWIACAQPSA